MRPVPWKVSPLPTLWLDPSTGYGVDSDGRKISPVIRGRRKNPNLEDLLNTAQVSGIKRVVLVGKIPERDKRTNRHWFQSDLTDWQHGKHWLDSGAPPVGRFYHKLQDMQDRHEKPYELSLVEAWFGNIRLSPMQAREAWELTQHCVIRSEESMQGLMKSPAATGQQLWAQSLPAGLDPQIVDDDIAELIHSTSGQHHIEHLVAGSNYIEHDLTRPLMQQTRGEAMPGFSYIDGRFMYAACGNELGVGPAQWVKGQQAREIWYGEANMRRVGPFLPARYHVRVRVPQDWKTLGILPLKHTTEDGRRTWVYPNVPGAVFETWVGNEELRLAEEFGWTIEKFFEAITFTSKKPAVRGEKRAVAARPLDTFCKRIVKARENVETIGAANNVAPVVIDAASAAIRQILLQTIGSFASRGRSSTVTVDSSWDIPPQYAHTAQRFGDKFVYREKIPLSAIPEKQRAYYRPELAAQVWSRARARVLHGPVAGGEKRGALHVDPAQLIGINGDAIYTTELPQWALPVQYGGKDDGAVGRLRMKGYLPAGTPDMALPTTIEARLRLARRAENAGIGPAIQQLGL